MYQLLSLRCIGRSIGIGISHSIGICHSIGISHGIGISHSIMGVMGLSVVVSLL